jgi:hypothetical protein
VFANGSVENVTLELGEGDGEVRLAAAGAHLSATMDGRVLGSANPAPTGDVGGRIHGDEVAKGGVVADRGGPVQRHEVSNARVRTYHRTRADIYAVAELRGGRQFGGGMNEIGVAVGFDPELALEKCHHAALYLRSVHAAEARHAAPQILLVIPVIVGELGYFDPLDGERQLALDGCVQNDANTSATGMEPVHALEHHGQHGWTATKNGVFDHCQTPVNSAWAS